MSIYVHQYKNAVMPVHDSDPIYKNTVPFCKKGARESDICFDSIINMCDYFYMGQFNDQSELSLECLRENFRYFEQHPTKHILDIEGDWGYRSVDPKIMQSGCKIIMNGVKKEYSGNLRNIFIRPTFSKLLMTLVSNEAFYLQNNNRHFSFMGFPDPFGVRKNMKKIIDDRMILNNIVFTDKWKGGSEDFDDHNNFIDNLISGTFSLCPRGTGVDSVRFLESCFFGRIPIVISDNVCFGHDFHKPFYFQMDRAEPQTLKEIQNLPINVINEYSRNAVEFFNTYVKKYFDNPTESFIKWDKR